MSSPLTAGSLAEVASAHEPPFLSLYQPTHRHRPENQQDPIRYRNLLKGLEASLRQQHPAAETARLLESFEALARDEAFWNRTLDGLAVLGAPGFFRVFLLPQPVTELAVAANSFHTKPLRRFLQSVDRYQVLELSRTAIRLLEGNRHALDEVDLVPAVLRTITESLGGEPTEPHENVDGGAGGANAPAQHGHGGKRDDVDVDVERFFRAADRGVLEYYSRPSGLPLILAALPEHHHLFRRVSENRLLVAEGIRVNPESLSAEELRSLAWKVMEPAYQARLAALVEEFEKARSKGTGSDDLTQVAEAAAAGRVASLLIEADRQIAGRLSTAGRVAFANLSDPQVDDLLDDLGELVEKTGGRVLVIPAEQMPTRTGLAAAYRY